MFRVDGTNACAGFENSMIRGFNSLEQALHFYYDPLTLTHDKLLLPKSPIQLLFPDQIPIPPSTVPLYFKDIANFPAPDPQGRALPPDEASNEFKRKVLDLATHAYNCGRTNAARAEDYFRRNDLLGNTSILPPGKTLELSYQYISDAELRLIYRSQSLARGTPIRHRMQKTAPPSAAFDPPRPLPTIDPLLSYTDKMISCKHSI